MEINELLKKKSYEELKEIAKEIEIPENQYTNRNQLLSLISKCFKEYEQYKTNMIDKYVKIKRLGDKGKEGITYLVKDVATGQEYAMKTFNKRKSTENIKKEAELQRKVSEKGICPVVIDVDLVSNCIIMEKMDDHLFDVMKKQCGNLTDEQQKQILDIFIKLDEASVFHGDSNILNYMLKNNKIYIIDFGMSKLIDDKFKKKLKEDKPNFTLMNLGFILKLKELKCPTTAYRYLIKYVSEENKIKYGLNN
jgi:tRNA A-37 threonylcarbamoyl transferase component Bud32